MTVDTEDVMYLLENLSIHLNLQNKESVRGAHNGVTFVASIFSFLSTYRMSIRNDQKEISKQEEDNKLLTSVKA